MRNRDYRFDVQLREGLAVEDWFYTMTAGGDRFEVKHDRLALETGNLYVEVEHDPGRSGLWQPSGLTTTEADCWIYVLGEPPFCFVGITVERLRELSDITPSTVNQPHGSCPTRGVLIPIWAVITDDLTRLAA